MIRFAAILVAILTLSGCSDRGTPLVIQNSSSLDLRSVHAIGSGFDVDVGDLAKGTEAEVNVYPMGESGLILSFFVEDKAMRLPISGYFEGGGTYKVKAVVSRDLSVDVRSDIVGAY